MIEHIEMVDIVKQYPLVRAVNHVSFTIRSRQIHSLLGENGAGKTCLMKILYGMTLPDQGEVLINGEKVSIKSPKDSIALGIGMVHQHFMLSPVLSVTENIIVEYGTAYKKRIHRLYKKQLKKFSASLTHTILTLKQIHWYKTSLLESNRE